MSQNIKSYTLRSSIFIVASWMLYHFATALEIAPHVSAFYPAPALALAFIAVYGAAYLPVYALALFVITFPSPIFLEHSPQDYFMGARQLVVWGGAGLCVHYLTNGLNCIRNTKEIILCLVGAFVLSFLSAVLARMIFAHYQTFPPEMLDEVMVSFWIGDTAGLIVAGPAIIFILKHLQSTMSIKELIQLLEKKTDYLELGLVAIIGSILATHFATNFIDGYISFHFHYLIVIPVIIGAARVGIARGYLAVLIANLLLIAMIINFGLGEISAIEFQMLFILMTIVALVVGSESSQRLKAITELSLSKVSLEKEVSSRTQSLKDSEERFKALSDASYGGIIIHEKGVILECNHGLTEITGYSKQELIGMNGFQLIGPEHLFIVQSNIKRGYDKSYKVEGVRKDGAVYPLAIRGKDVKYNGRDVRVIEFQDITEWSKLQDQLQESKDKAEKAYKSKSDFLANISHDLRTPLNAVIGFSDIMQNETYGPLGDPHYKEYAVDIENSGRLLLSLIDDILDVSKLEAGKYVLTEDVVDLPAYIKMSIKMVHTQAKEKNIALTEASEPNIPMLKADGVAVTQILNNLLSNAIKFTPDKGEVVASAKATKGGELKLIVIDNGIGMSQEDIAKAIRPYEQVNTEHSSTHKGTGLGLYLCCNLVDLHGGEMTIESNLGKGTKISVTFPTDRVVQAA